MAVMDENRGRGVPGVDWLRARLSRKMILILLVVSVLGWLVSCFWFLGFLQDYAQGTYDGAMEQAEDSVHQVAEFLKEHPADWVRLEELLEKNKLGCTIQTREGEPLFFYLPKDWSSPQLTASGGELLDLEELGVCWVQIWHLASTRQALSDTLGHQAFIGLSIFNLTLFFSGGVLIYCLIVAPIIRLRKTMEAYSQHGVLPPSSERRDEIGRLQNSFAELARVLKAKEHSERRLIASVSHDIKTPLTSVLGYSERLLSAQLSQEKQGHYLHSIHDKGVAIKSILDELDDYLEAGLRTGTPIELMTVRSLCQILEREYAEELRDAGVRLEVKCLCPDARLLCNPAHMRRYFGNLIGNSIQHSGAHPLYLETVFRQEGDRIILTFSDNGQGVPEELLSDIFEPLYTTDRGRKVSGLGLAICKSIIQAHGGTIRGENREKGGLLIWAELPCAPVYQSGV